MVFSSAIFLFLFLPLTLAAHFATRSVGARNGVLLAASLVYYAWGEPRYLWLLLLYAGLSYALGLAISAAVRAGNARRAGLALLGGVILFVAGLAYYKYAGFLAENWNALASLVGFRSVTLEKIALPLGISFLAFHCISYLVDVYSGQAPAQRNPLRLLLYFVLFPHLIAGPIIRYKTLHDSLGKRRVTLEGFEEGVFRFAIGLFKKSFLAAQLGQLITQVQGIEQPTHASAWLTAVAFSFQVYFDFSGYSDMAIGLAKFFGFVFPENFRHPFVSRSVTEFWSRWHISLSEWIRDYLFFPISLSGERARAFRLYFALFFSMTVSGLWHGATWNFVVWGAYYGILMVAERLFLARVLERLPRAFSHAYLLLVVVLGFEVFRAKDLPAASHSIRLMFSFAPEAWASLAREDLIVNYASAWILVLSCLGSAPILDWLVRAWRALPPTRLVGGLAGSARFATIALALLVGAVMAAKGTHQPFIYFRF